jgi:hypothetical protein
MLDSKYVAWWGCDNFLKDNKSLYFQLRPMEPACLYGCTMSSLHSPGKKFVSWLFSHETLSLHDERALLGSSDLQNFSAPSLMISSRHFPGR